MPVARRAAEFGLLAVRTLDEAVLKTAFALAGEWPTFGYRRFTGWRRLGWPVNAKRVRRWMHELNLRRTAQTNLPHHQQQPCFPTLPQPRRKPGNYRPNQVWVADITYIRLQPRVRLPRRAHGCIHPLHPRLASGPGSRPGAHPGGSGAGPGEAIPRFTIPTRESNTPPPPTSNACGALGVTLSMAAVGEPRENGYAERLMRTIKEEEVDLSEYHDFADARRQIGRFLDDVYNVKRIHSSLGYLTPAGVRGPVAGEPAPATTTSDLSGG